MIGWTRQWTIFVLLLVFSHLIIHVGFGIGGLAPDLLTVTALLSARRLPIAAAVAFGFVIGMLADSFAVHGFAATGLGLAVVCGLGSLSRDYFDGDSLLFSAVYLLLGATLAGVLAATLAGRSAQAPLGLPMEALLRAVYTGFAGSVAMAAYRELTGPRA